MEVFIILILLVLLILLIIFNSGVNSKLERLQADMRNLQLFVKKTAERQSDLLAGHTPGRETTAKPPEPLIQWQPEQEHTADTTAPETEVAPVLPPPEPLITPLPTPQPADEPMPVTAGEPVPVREEEQLATAAMQAAPVQQTPPPVYPQAPAEPGFFERNPDLEKFIGENLISKIGIAILVIAIGFFVKFAIDNNWIGPVGRVGIGLLCGGILVGIAHKMHTAYKAFSSVLIGGGLAVFYFSIALAYKDYHLFNQTAAFVIMVIITAFAVMISLLYDRQEVAVIALVGGFCVPFIVSDGSGSYATLFIYLLLLNTGLLIIAYRKAWRLLNILAFAFTILLFGSWLGTLPDTTPLTTYRNGLIFATLFYLLFLAINIAHNVKQQKQFIASDFGIILANTALYFSAGLYMIYSMKAPLYVGLFSGLMGAFNLAVCSFLFRNKYMDKNVLYLLIGITLTFISLTIPLQLHGHFITLFWAAEAVLLYWLYQKSKISLMKITSLTVWVLMLISLLMDWQTIYSGRTTPLMLFVNKGFITTLFAAVSSYGMYLLRKAETEQRQPGSLPFLPRQVFLCTGIILLYLGGCFETDHQLSYYLPDSNVNTLYLLAYTFAFILVLHILSSRNRLTAIPQVTTIVLMGLGVLAYLCALPYVIHLLTTFLYTGKNGGHFMVHWLGAALTGILIYRLLNYFRTGSRMNSGKDAVAWVACLVIVIFISVEMQLLMYRLFYRDPASLVTIERVYIKAGLPIIWGLCSFIFMWLGMGHKYRPLRIISLSLFLITLLKLFIFDIQNIPVAGKIAAFFCLGVLLLVVSFMYQRLKKIIAEDEPKKDL